MPRFRKPFYRKSRDLWYVELDGKQHNLGRDEKEAFRKYHELMNKPEAVASELVVGIIDGFLDWCQKHRKETTFDWYRKHLQSFIRTVPNAKDFAVPDLKPFHVYDWTDAQKDWGDTYRRGAMTALQRAFLWAEKLGHIVKSPIRYLEKPEAKKRDNPLSAEDFQLMLSKIKEGDPFRDLVLFAWYTGARPQEIRHIEPRHVNLNAARIEIPPDEAKGQKRWRKIYLIEPALEIVNKMLARHKDGKLFRNKRGKAWKCFAITCRFYRLKAKLGKRFAIYDFRHSFCQQMLENGTDHVTVAALMGHKDATMVSKVYSHMNKADEHLQKALEVGGRERIG